MKIPKEIEQEYILKAVESYRNEGLPPLCYDDTTYKVIIENEEFPPPAIAKYAFKHKYNEWPEEFDGGIGTDCFKMLENAGYKIISKSTNDNDYLDLEGFVFNHLMDRHKKDGLTFSVRQKAGKKSELDYFIGTAESNYSAFSLWNIPVESFLATDVIDFIFSQDEPDKFKIELQFLVSHNLESEQDRATIELGNTIKTELEKLSVGYSSSKEGNKHYKFVSKLADSEFTGRDKFIVGLDNYIKFYSEIVNNSIAEVKNKFTQFKAEIYSKSDFDKLITRLNKRREKYLKVFSTEPNNVSIKQAFHNWLIKKYGDNSGTPSSYLKAIERLSKILGSDIYSKSDQDFLKSLYNELIKEQTNPDGKYYDPNAESYGKRGFYSASIKAFSEYLNSNSSNGPKNNYLLMSYPLNTILYGPPGTGKTYNTVLRAAEIIENRKIASYSEALAIFKANLHEQIEFITFHQNYSYEDFIQGLRPDTENDNQLTFDKKDGIFKVIADKALQNLEDSERPPVAKRIFEDVFNEFINPLVEGEVEEIEIKMKKVSYFITAITNKSIDFRKASGGTAHTLSIGTLKKMYTDESVLDIQGLASYYSPLLESLLKIGKDSSGKKVEIIRKNYVIIIDEINRANISRVFGELITLIEPDKRSHGAIPIEAKLPSGDPFVVPSNLFIIGTMNTADKSIALLDIALRRRFEFEAMYPKYEIEGQEIYDVDILKKINEQIIKSKGHDFQIGHAYFMGENNNLVSRMNKKVIPLLLEYYMNDEKEVKGILQSSGLVIEENSWPLKITGTND
jgi:hypothetical protein